MIKKYFPLSYSHYEVYKELSAYQRLSERNLQTIILKIFPGEEDNSFYSNSLHYAWRERERERERERDSIETRD
jgi:hypothetical protein